MNPLDNRYIGCACEIRSFANELLGIGEVKEIGEDYIIIGARDDRLKLFNTFSKLKLNIFNSKAGFMFVICEVLTSDANFLKVVSPVKIIDHERRSGFRVTVDVTAKISSNLENLDQGGYETMQMVWVKDMSVCGLKIHTKRQFITGQIVWIKLCLDNDFVIVKAQIIRAGGDIIGEENGEKIREYGVKLMFDKEDDTDKLCSYIFKVQREQSQKVR